VPALRRIHLDTDFAGDTDDACALAFLLGCDDVELVGVTTVADPDGRRAGYAAHVLALAGRSDVPVATGAGASLDGRSMGDLPDHGRYWFDPIVAVPPEDAAATGLLASAVSSGATVVAIGPFTNLAVAARAEPGLLAGADVVVMGGFVVPPAEGLPPWGPDHDWNVWCDPTAALEVFGAGSRLTITSLSSTAGVWLRERDLPRLEAAGPLGALLAHQARAHGREHDMQALAAAHPGLPDDLLNFQHDPLACAVAAGWPGAPVEDLDLEARVEEGVLSFPPAAADAGVRCGVVGRVDSDAFADEWLAAVERASAHRSGNQSPDA
jgi:inosine-uridine nucleoside N-ribohydrolase